MSDNTINSLYSDGTDFAPIEMSNTTNNNWRGGCVGRRIGDFAVFSLVVPLIIPIAFWGYSGNNRTADSSPPLWADVRSGEVESYGSADVPGDRGNDNNIPPELANLKDAKYVDPTFMKHLHFDNSENVKLQFAASTIDRKGGVLSAKIDGQPIDFYFRPSSIPEETNINLVVQKGRNDRNEELYIFYLAPENLIFSEYPILEMQVPASSNVKAGASYELYGRAAGSWLKYYSLQGNQQGILKFYIPHLSTYALLVRNSLAAENLER